MTKTTRTRSDYLAQLQREKAERLIGAIQEVAKTGDVKPFKERCWAMKSQENKRIKRAKQRRDSAAGNALRALVSSPSVAANPVVVQLYAQLAQFEAARVNLLQLLQADNALFNAKLALLNGEYKLLASHFAVLASMGRLQEALNVVSARADEN